MPRRVLVLVLAVLALTMLNIDLRHRNRLQFAALQTLHSERDALDIEWGQLLLEQATWAEHRRIENVARTQLGMTMPRPEQVTVVHSGMQP